MKLTTLRLLIGIFVFLSLGAIILSFYLLDRDYNKNCCNYKTEECQTQDKNFSQLPR